MLEQISFLAQVIGVPVVILLVLHLPFWIINKKKNRITKLDYAYPFAAVLSWVFFASLVDSLNLAGKSIANIFFELLLVVIVSFMGYIAKTFIPTSEKNKNKAISILYVGMVAFVIILTLCMPLIPE